MTAIPPDPAETVARTKGAGRVAPGSVPPSYKNYSRAMDPTMESFTDAEGRGIGVTEAMGAIDLASPEDLTRKERAAGLVPRNAGDVIFGEMMAAGPYEAIAYEDEWGSVSSTLGEFYRTQAGRYLNDDEGYGYTNYGTPPSAIGVLSRDPAPITQAPTSTTNPARPRTVAAGYDKDRRVLTTVFRDGTFYNYYEVSNLEWSNFTRARSKGRYIHAWLDAKSRGVANVSSLPQSHRELLYKAARTTQVMKGGYTKGQKVGSKRGTGGRYAYGNVGSATSGGRAFRRAKGAGRYL